jgi:hypothetical protein
MTPRTSTLILIAAALTPALAQAHDPSARLRNLEPAVMVEREDGWTEEASLNLPLFPGDRLWTREDGRAELQFADGTLLQLDRASRVDYVAHPEEASERSQPVLLRLWAGSAYLHTASWPQAERYELETPHGLVRIERPGLVRVEASGYETRLSVLSGRAILAVGNRAVRVAADETSRCRLGFSPAEPERLSEADDELAQWNASLPVPTSEPTRANDFLPVELAPFGEELEHYGAWFADPRSGQPVWRPFVSETWEPYTQGRWYWTIAGWSWVSEEPWGWAPYHFGHWDLDDSLGWYWVPENVWAPAWVTWAYDDEYVGWCWANRDGAASIEYWPSHRRNCFFTHRRHFHERDLRRQRVELGRNERRRLKAAPRGSAAPLGRDPRTPGGAAKKAPPDTGSGPEKRHPTPTNGGTPPDRVVEKKKPVPPGAPERNVREETGQREVDEQARERRRQEDQQAAERKIEEQRRDEERRAEEQRATERRIEDQRRQDEERAAERRRQEEQQAAERRIEEQRRQDEERAAERRRQEEQQAAERRIEEQRAAEQRREEERKVIEQRNVEPTTDVIRQR